MGISRGYDLTERLRLLGAPDPEEWAASELEEDLAQEARWLAIRHVWPDAIDSWTADNVRLVPAAQRAVAAGADPEDVARAMRAAAYDAAFAVLSRIDEGCDPLAPEDAPGWELVEIRYDAAGDGAPTGREVGGLHESLLGADPSGREGADLWE